MFLPDENERFWSHVQRSNACWLWTQKLNQHGYGYFGLRLPRVTVRAHRYSFALEHGEQYLFGTRVGPTHEIDHCCRVRNCVRPDHLEWVTQAENLRRQAAAIWTPECRNGHDRVLWWRKDKLGQNFCLICRREADRRRRARERATA